MQDCGWWRSRVEWLAVEIAGSNSGATMAILAVLIPLTMGFAALAVDTALWHTTRRDVQMAADASAIAGAMEMARAGHTTQDIRDAAANDAELNGYVDGADDTAITVTPDETAQTVAVVVEHDAISLFAQFTYDGNVTVSGHATAAVLDVLNNACILALDPTAAQAMLLDSNAHVVANGCGVHVNSDNASALETAANADVTSESTCVVGSYQGSGYSPMPEVGCDRVEDPFDGLPEPDSATCDHTDFETDMGEHDLSPGVYCGGISADSNAELNFASGTYVIKDGPLHLDSNVVASGEEVTFVFTGTGAVLDLNSNTVFDVTAPSTGDYSGMAIIEDADNPALQEHRINSNGTVNIEGTMYLPQGKLEIDSNSMAGNSAAYTMVIARRIHLDSNATLEVNSNYDGSTPLPSALDQRVALVQ